jgi:hypothetical protein
MFPQFYQSQKEKNIQFVQKKTKERDRELKKDLKRINLLFNLM